MPSRRQLTCDDRRREREKARAWWNNLSAAERWELGDQLVLGTFDFMDFGLSRRPSSVFLNEVDYQRMLWESMEDC